MKRSPYASSPSSCSSSLSSSSSTSSSSSSYHSSQVRSESEYTHASQPEKHNPKRPRKGSNKSQEKCLNAAATPTPSRRSSIYRGVTRHRWTGRYEAHLWDKSSWNNIRNKKGRQVYLGAYDNEEAAARTYDLAALKYWGPETILNFSVDSYAKEIDEMQKATKEEYLASLRRRSSGFSRGVSKYRGVARHHHNGRWEARIGRVFGNKYLYLGTYNTQEEAAAAYDMAAIEYRGPTAVTNFDISHYVDRLKMKGRVALDNLNCSGRLDEPEPAGAGPPPSSSLQSCEQKKEPQCLALANDPCGQFTTGSISMVESIGEGELDWSFCLDTGLASLPMPEIRIENRCEFPGLFENAGGFEDDIGMMFDAGSHEVEEIGNAGVLIESSSPSDSPVSSTTSTVTL